MNRSTLSPAWLFIPVLSMLLVSCSHHRARGPAIVAGDSPDLASREIKTEIHGREYRTTADAEGRFLMVLDLTDMQYPWFTGINKCLYLLPGDSLYIAAGDPYEFSGGESGLINTYYARVDANLQVILDTINIPNYYSQEPAAFRDFIDRVLVEWTGFLDRFAAENPGIGRDFISLEKERLRHYWLAEMNIYYDENKAYTGVIPEIPDDFYDYLETVRLNDTTLFKLYGYDFFLQTWVDLQNQLTGNPRKGYGETQNLLDIAENSFTEPVILAYVVRDILQKQSSRMKVDEEVIARAERLGADEEFIRRLRKNVEAMQPLTSGNPAADFEILDVDGKAADLKVFRGKYLLIDVWSHTCSPCLREIPRMEDLKHEMEGRNLEIIAVCLSDEEHWKNKMNEMGLPADGQYRVEGGWGSRFSKDYLKFSGVPVYILIDPEGRIVIARAPYPSKGLKELLEGLPI